MLIPIGTFYLNISFQWNMLLLILYALNCIEHKIYIHELHCEFRSRSSSYCRLLLYMYALHVLSTYTVVHYMYLFISVTKAICSKCIDSVTGFGLGLLMLINCSIFELVLCLCNHFYSILNEKREKRIFMAWVFRLAQKSFFSLFSLYIYWI